MGRKASDFPLLPAVHYAEGRVTDGALLLEGGSFRGIYTAGVCDVLMEQGIHLQCVAGVSAGALNAINITARQVGRFAGFCLLHRDDPRYTGIGALLQNGGLMGFRFLFHTLNKKYPLGDTFPATDRRFAVFATDVESGEAVCFEQGQDLLKASQASSSIALASRTVKLGGRRYLDGGYAVSFPLDWAIGQGYDKKVVVLTRELSFRKPPVRESTMRKVRRRYRRYPAFCEAVERVPAQYARERERLEALASRGEAFVIAPEEPVTISPFEKDTDKLYALYVSGRQDAERKLPALKVYLGLTE